MEKKKITKKELGSMYKEIYAVNYCELQTLFKYSDAKFFTSSSAGWDGDVFEISDKVAIHTGYRHLVGEQIDDDFCKKYEDKAQKLVDDYCHSNAPQPKAYNKLLLDLDNLKIKFIDDIHKEKSKDNEFAHDMMKSGRLH